MKSPEECPLQIGFTNVISLSTTILIISIYLRAQNFIRRQNQ